VAELSEWLQIMLGEIARKRDELARAQEEEALHRQEGPPAREDLPAATPAESPESVSAGKQKAARKRA